MRLTMDTPPLPNESPGEVVDHETHDYYGDYKPPHAANPTSQMGQKVRVKDDIAA